MRSATALPSARRPIVALAGAALVAAVLPFAAGVPTQAASGPTGTVAAIAVPAPAMPDLGPAIESEADYQGQTLCSPKVKAGAAKLAALIRATYGTSSIGISRPCSDGGQSEHKEGRALDWMLKVTVAAQKAKADSFLAWLLAADKYGNPAAMAKRLGVMYIGWNNKFWRGYDVARGWTDLKGCSTDKAKKAAAYDTYCHRNHIHISLTWEGASALTSFWTGTPLAPTCTQGWGTSSAGPAVAGGDLVPVTPVRVLDTRRGTGQVEPCRLGQQRWSGDRRDLVVSVLGHGGVPSRNVAAVAVRVAVTRASSPGPTVVARTTATSTRIAVVTPFSTAEQSSTAVVPVASDGTIRLSIDRGSADVTVDVLGYAAPRVLSPAPTAATTTGLTHVMAPTTVYEAPGSPLQPGETRTITVAGRGGIPTANLSGVLLTVLAARTTATSWVTISGAPGTSVVAGVRAATSTHTAAQVFLPGPSGTVTLRNTGKAPVTVAVRASGWTTTTASAGGARLALLAAPVVVADTSTGRGFSGPASLRSVGLSATGPVPSGAQAVLVQVSAKGGSSAAPLTLAARGSVRTFGLSRGKWAHDVVLLPIGSDRRITVGTTSLGSTVRLTVLGYVS